MLEVESNNIVHRDLERSARSAAAARPGFRRPRRSLEIAPVFAIASGKGGVGKTNITANLAAALVHKRQRVLTIDADAGLANLDLLFGVKPVYTLEDFFSGAAALDEIVITTPQGVLLLPGANGVQSLTALSNAQKLVFAGALETLARKMDIVLVDTCSGVSDLTTYFAAAAQEILVVVTPEPASLADAYALIKILASTYGEKRFQVLTNNVDDDAQSRRIFDSLSRVALRFLNVSLDHLGCIPRDPCLMTAIARSRLVIEDARDAPSARSFDMLATRLLESCAAGGRVKGNLQFFLRQVRNGMEGAR
jgi:flagellar biosynthesis protein FlhG